MPKLDPHMRAIAREFRDRPIGRHSPALEAVLDVLRAGPVRGKYCLVCVTPHREWQLARMIGRRGEPPVPCGNHVYRSIAEAEWDVFKRRWREATGQSIDDDDLDAGPGA